MPDKISVGLLHSWDGPGPARQWPAKPPPEFENIAFRFKALGRVDYAFVLNDVPRPTQIVCAPENIWGFIQEPPIEAHAGLHRGRPYFARVYTTDETLIGPRYQPFWSALQWAVGKSYDELVAEPLPVKSVDLSWVTSNLALLDGHRTRMAFLEGLQAAQVPLELYGRGFRPVERKWDVLSKSRYTISFENYRGGIYWSEKLTDAFLSFATPIYFGARDIDRYFPKNSYLSFDLDDKHLFDRIKDVVASDFHEQHRAELLEARDLCLNKYNSMFYLAGLARDDFAKHGHASKPQRIRLEPAVAVPTWKRLVAVTRRGALAILPDGVTRFVRRQKRRLFPIDTSSQGRG